MLTVNRQPRRPVPAEEDNTEDASCLMECVSCCTGWSVSLCSDNKKAAGLSCQEVCWL